MDKAQEEYRHAIRLHRDGFYEEACEILQTFEADPHIVSMIIDCLIKSNQSEKAVAYTTVIFRQIFSHPDKKKSAEFASIFNRNYILNVGQRAFFELMMAKDEADFTLPKSMTVDETLELKNYNNYETLVFCSIWPCAYGDMIVYNQFIKHYKDVLNAKSVIVIAPLNRPELSYLFKINDAIDKIIDITLMDEEENRLASLGLINNKLNIDAPRLNVVEQELEILRILKFLPDAKIMKMRYLPFFFGVDYVNLPRMWEERARLFLKNKIELPKLIEQKEVKENQIVVHFREGKYNDSEARDIDPVYAQDLIDKIKLTFPDYEIVRLMDKQMSKIEGVKEIYVDDGDISKQILEIQKAKLFVGSHSAPQHLVVACSDTPIICVCYTAQETTVAMDDNIARMSYEPVGSQVRKIFYQKMHDAAGNELIPIQNNTARKSLQYPEISEVIESMKEILE